MTPNQILLMETFPHLPFVFDENLAAKCYFQIGGPAEIFLATADLLIVRKLLIFADQQRLPLTILGDGSNILIADAGLRGLVVQILAKEIDILSQNEKQATIRVAAGAKMSQLAIKASQLGLTGLEGFLTLPGTVGGAVYNNAHYGQKFLGQLIQDVQVFDYQTQKTLVLKQDDCHFAYEHSIFQEKKSYLIEKIILTLPLGKAEVIKERMLTAQKQRLATQPLNYPSAGCFFKNPPNTSFLKKQFPQFANQQTISAGFLIEQAGLKGKKVGQIQVSEKHAAFLLNLGGGSAKDVLALEKIIKDEIYRLYQVKLQREVFYLH